MYDPSKSSLKIQHNPPNPELGPEARNDFNKEILALLLELVSPAKFEMVHKDSIVQLQNDIKTLLGLKKIAINKVGNIQFCLECQDFFTKPLKCGCYLCHHLYYPIDLQLQEFLKTAPEALVNLPTFNCPNCGNKIDEKDLEKLCSEFKRKKNESKVLRNKRSIIEQSVFICETCNKERGKDMFPEPELLACQHMCKICICKAYHDERNEKCVQCIESVQLNRLIQEQFFCSMCGDQFYLLGDRMLESSAGVLLCFGCIMDAVNRGSCPKTGRIYSLEDKKEFIQYIYLQCSNCDVDVLQVNALRLLCCNVMVCEDCVKSGRCSNCKKSISS